MMQETKTTDPLLSISPRARDRLVTLMLHDPEAPRLVLWLDVTGVVDGRYAYDLTFRYRDEVRPGDVVQQHDDLTVVIPVASAPKLRGASIDLEGDDARGTLAIENPNRPSAVGMMLPVVPKLAPGTGPAEPTHADHAGHAHHQHAHAAEGPQSSPAVGAHAAVELSGDVATKVRQVLEGAINPSIAAHGGHAELVAVEDDTAFLRLSGGCQGCGLATVTLSQGIQAAISDAIPEIRRVVDVTDHAAGTNPFFEPAKK